MLKKSLLSGVVVLVLIAGVSSRAFAQAGRAVEEITKQTTRQISEAIARRIAQSQTVPTADRETRSNVWYTFAYNNISDADIPLIDFDIDIFQSTNVPTANAAADRSGAVFVRGYALGMVHKWAAKIETMRWAPIRGFVLVATAMYGVGEIEDSAGLAATTDA